MPESLKALRRRIRSIKSTKQVTRAMEMVAAAKLRRSQQALMAARPYVRNLETLLGRLAPEAEAAGHPLFCKRAEVFRSTLVLFTADRGLCGNYNNNLIQRAEKKLRECPLGSIELVCVGRKGADYFARRHWPVAEEYRDLGGVLNREESDTIAADLRERFLSGETDQVELLYSAYVSASVNKPTFSKFLEMDADALLAHVAAEDRQPLEYLFEPNRESLFDTLLPEYLRSKIFITLAEAFTSEHSSRMLAMNNASNNCDDLVDQLTLSLNKARQGAITSDLLDIVGGAEALRQAL